MTRPATNDIERLVQSYNEVEDARLAVGRMVLAAGRRS
jgi:hypothetical protein